MRIVVEMANMIVHESFDMDKNFYKAPQPQSNSNPLQKAEFNLGFSYGNLVTCNTPG